jgi:hypothetical protein
LADHLGISSAITTRHISLLEEAGIIRSENIPGKRGLQKLCHLAVDKITLSFEHQSMGKDYQVVSIPVGQFSAYEVSPPCGLASPEGYIGVCDDPRYFSDPAHVNAALLWFQSGWVEYRIPSYIISSRPIHAIDISLEICSEFPGYKEDWPSDIHFYLNGILIGVWTSPGDFGKKKESIHLIGGKQAPSMAYSKRFASPIQDVSLMESFYQILPWTSSIFSLARISPYE